MEIVKYTDARQNLKGLMDRVVDDVTEVVVTRQKGEAVVLVSLTEWNSINETLHLLSSPKNAERLHASISQLDSGAGVERELAEEEEPVGA